VRQETFPIRISSAALAVPKPALDISTASMPQHTIIIIRFIFSSL
jgi:hypothetical protein